jgi:hypothetical protein
MGGVRVFEKCMQVIYNQTGTDVKGELGEW